MSEQIKRSITDNWFNILVYIILGALAFGRIDAKMNNIDEKVNRIEAAQHVNGDKLEDMKLDVGILKDHDQQRQIIKE